MQRKTITVRPHFHVEAKAEHIETRWLPGPVGGENGEIPPIWKSPFWQFSSSKSTHFQLENELVLRLNVQHGTIVNSTLLYIRECC